MDEQQQEDREARIARRAREIDADDRRDRESAAAFGVRVGGVRMDMDDAPGWDEL